MTCLRLLAALWVHLGVWILCANAAYAQALTPELEALRIPNVGSSWVNVASVNSYTTAVVTCTYTLPSNADNDATVRLRNVSGTGFEVRVQQFETSNSVASSAVHCLMAEVGAHTLLDGRKFEAHTVLSDQTNGQYIGWGAAQAENVTSSLLHSYTTPVVLGSVMTFNDTQASVFWTFNCTSRGAPPTASAVCVGKHIGMITDTRLPETLGYIVIEAGNGTSNDVSYTTGLSADNIAGTGNSPPYNIPVSGDFETAVLTQAAEDGGNGGWAVLYGNDPLPNNAIQTAIEEETFAGDTSRRHTSEQVFYAAFSGNQSASVSASKTVAVYDPLSDGIYMLPGNDVIYSLEFENSGSAPLDSDTLFLVDKLPIEVEFYNGDIDDGGPETGAVAVDLHNSGLSFDTVSDVGYSNSATAPTSFASCNYTPASGYDPNVKYICFAPKGRMKAGAIYTDVNFTVQFRARIL